MVRLHVLVEGQTEETFVKNVLQIHFNGRGIYLYPRLIGKPGHRGGIGEYPRARRDILTTLKQDAGALCTRMFDYYGMPGSCRGARRQGKRHSQRMLLRLRRRYTRI